MSERIELCKTSDVDEGAAIKALIARRMHRHLGAHLDDAFPVDVQVRNSAG